MIERREMDTLAVASMNVGLLVQNYAEWRAGGPRPPTKTEAREIPASTRTLALILTSVFVAGVSVMAVAFNAGWPIALLAAALIANALFQGLASVWSGSLQPGTVSGLLVMLPTSIWAMASVQNPFGWLVVLLGPLLSVPLLLFVWWVARQVTQRLSL